MMILCVLACLEGRGLPILLVLSRKGPLDQSKLANTPNDETKAEPPPPPVFNPEDLVGRSFLMDKQADGQQFRGQIVKLIEDH
jgi:hypothetical protein